MEGYWETRGERASEMTWETGHFGGVSLYMLCLVRSLEGGGKEW